MPTYFRDQCDRILLRADSVFPIIIIIGQNNYLYQTHCLKETYQATYLPIWNFKFDPLASPGPAFFLQKKSASNSFHTCFAIFQNFYAFLTQEGRGAFTGSCIYCLSKHNFLKNAPIFIILLLELIFILGDYHAWWSRCKFF